MEEWTARECVEMPANVVGLRAVDGRLMVDLADGRTIDMTDWFAPDKAAH